MLDAISLLMQNELEDVWIDQLCIQQSEYYSEKSNAIASMDFIYSAAQLLVIVLEDIELTRDELRVWRNL